MLLKMLLLLPKLEIAQLTAVGKMGRMAFEKIRGQVCACL
jgi:hypothetical protein